MHLAAENLGLRQQLNKQAVQATLAPPFLRCDSGPLARFGPIDRRGAGAVCQIDARKAPQKSSVLGRKEGWKPVDASVPT